MVTNIGYLRMRFPPIFFGQSTDTTKIKLADNKKLTDKEFNFICEISDIFTAIRNVAGDERISPPIGGVYWHQAKPGMGPYEIFMRKDRNEIDHLFLLFNAFRDFCAYAYEFDALTPKPDYWVRRYLRLCASMPKRWRIAMPARFAELGWSVNGYPINRWTSVNQERINMLALAGILPYLEHQSCARILEIGGGAGELGYSLAKSLKHSSWYNADLLGCLFYSAIQLAINLPKKKHFIYVGNLPLPEGINQNLILRCPQKASRVRNAIVSIPHFLLGDFKDKLHVNLAYNTYSFGEMPQSAVTSYVELLANFCEREGVLFEQNGYFPERGGDDPEAIISRSFTAIPFVPLFDGRWLPNGPIRIWSNNDLGQYLRDLLSDQEVSHLLHSLQDHDDQLDIAYPNEKLWPKVYELFASSQRVQELFPW